MSWGYRGFSPYVSVAERRRKAAAEMSKLVKKGQAVKPVAIEGRTIARTFWGKAWCDNLESYMDYENRLPRGRTYVRNGSVVHLDIQPGQVEAIVSGSELYKIKITIASVVQEKWAALCRECAGSIGSLVELLQGRFSDHVMGTLTRKETGLFPSPKEIKLTCSCPDWANMCKHVAAVLYGVGARLDHQPELLFVLRSVNHEDLIAQAASADQLAAKTAAATPELAESELGEVFGIELESTAAPAIPPKKAAARAKLKVKAKASIERRKTDRTSRGTARKTAKGRKPPRRKPPVAKSKA